MTDSRETAGGSLIILDLDDFKKINDNYGHLVGDRALKILTDTLMATFRRRDIIGRLGGDEFLVFIKSVTSREILDKRMKELFVSLAQTEELNLTCSVGICIMEREGFSYEEGLKKADTALYKSKKEGKTDILIMKRQDCRNLKFTEQEAVVSGSLSVYFQRSFLFSISELTAWARASSLVICPVRQRVWILLSMENIVSEEEEYTSPSI